MTDAQSKPPWISHAILIGIVYALIGVFFGVPDTHVQAWRYAAWIASAIVYATHICYEYFRQRNSAKSTALHVAIAVAIGGLALAVGAVVNSLFASPNYSRWRFGLALMLWPILTGLPAFIVALLITFFLSRFRPSKTQS
jgi:hypothetical protein